MPTPIYFSPGYGYVVEIDRHPVGSFGSIESPIPEVTRRLEPLPATSLLLPAVQSARQATFGNVTLMRSSAVSKPLFEWISQLSRHGGARKDISIVRVGPGGRELARLKLMGALPRPNGVVMKDGSDNVTLENFTITFTGLE